MTAVHRNYLELAAAGIDFALTPTERARLGAHVAGCDACRRRIAAMRSDNLAIAALPRHVLRAKTAERLDPVRPRVRWAPGSGPTLRLIAVAALLALLAIGALTSGAEFLRRELDRDLALVPPQPTAIVDEPSAAPSALPSALPSGPPLVGAAWRSLGRPEPMRDHEIGALAPNGSKGLIAGGCVQLSFGAGCTDAAVWLSANGAEWSEAVLLPGLEGETAGPVRVIASSPDRLIAAGVVDRNDVRAIALWTSADGTSWARVLDGPSFESAEVYQVEWIGRRWVAIGSGSFGEPAEFRAWMSEDGLTWSQADFPASTDSAYPTRFVEVDEGLLAVGPRSSVSQSGSQWWQSSDGGVTWQTVEDPVGLENVAVSWLQSDDAGRVAYGQNAAPPSTSGVWTRTASGPGWIPDNENTGTGGRIGQAVTVGQGTVAVVTPESGEGAVSIWYHLPNGRWVFAAESGAAESIGLAQHPTQPQRLFLVVRDIDGRHTVWSGEVDWAPWNPSRGKSQGRRGRDRARP